MLLAGMLLSACVGITQRVERPVLPDPAQPQPEVIPSSVVTLQPALTETKLPTVQVTVEPGQPSSTPASDQTVPGPQFVFTPDAPASKPWKDCSVAAGWIGCDPNAPAFAARVAFFLPALPAVVALDLDSSVGWTVPSAIEAAGPRINWSPKAAYLLTAQNMTTLSLYQADGVAIGSLPLADDQTPPAWQPNGELAFAETVWSEQGAQAQLLQASDLRWQVSYQSAPGAAPQILNLETEMSDRLYHLISFVPGTNLLLGQTYYAGNQAMMQGAQLFTLDVLTGEHRNLEAMAPLGWQAGYAWKQSGDQPALLAFIDTAGAQVGLPTLSLFDFAAGSLNRPLPPGVGAADPAWDPETGRLAFSAKLLGEVDDAAAATLYSLQGIYLYSPENGEVRAVTQPPGGARDGLPTWTGDGQWLVYARYFDSGVLEVRAVQADGAQDHRVVTGLAADCPAEGPGCPWGNWLSIMAR